MDADIDRYLHDVFSRVPYASGVSVVVCGVRGVCAAPIEHRPCVGSTDFTHRPPAVYAGTGIVLNL